MASLISTLENGKADFFDLLVKRMEEGGDFPAWSKSIEQLDELMRDEDKNIAQIANVILSDFTLTQKIIRLANSEMYSKMSNGITTISHAIAVLGLHAISNIVLNIHFIDTLSASASHSGSVRAELQQIVLTGEIARNIASKSKIKNVEEAVVCAMMHHIGRLMLVFYFPDEWLKIQQIAKQDYSRESEASLKIIGLTIDEISQEMAKLWRLPVKISNSMVSSVTLDKTSIPGTLDWLKVMANFSGNVASMLTNKAANKNVQDFVSRYSRSLLISKEDILSSIEQAAKKTNSADLTEHDKRSEKLDNFRNRLTAGLIELSFAIAQKIDFNSALSIVLETIYAGLKFNRVIVFFRDSETYIAHSYFGNLNQDILSQLVFSESYTADVFHLSLKNRADVFIQSVISARESSIPDWHRAALPDAGAFILLPMFFEDNAIGTIYADWCEGDIQAISPDEFLALGMLRDQLMRSLAK
ncbi:MAG: HDOD domain-containing protein [Nitrosomonas sp.]|nr:MAG: HDOD domain-containing protein [Nitrosomonas sp.]